MPVVDSVIDAGATELFRPMEVVRTLEEAGPHSAVTKVPLFSDSDTTSDSELSLECFELMSMTSEDRREFRVAPLDSLRGLGGKMTVCGAK